MECKKKEVKTWYKTLDEDGKEISTFKVSNECGKRVALNHSESKCKKCKRIIQNGK